MWNNLNMINVQPRQCRLHYILKNKRILSYKKSKLTLQKSFAALERSHAATLSLKEDRIRAVEVENDKLRPIAQQIRDELQKELTKYIALRSSVFLSLKHQSVLMQRMKCCSIPSTTIYKTSRDWTLLMRRRNQESSKLNYGLGW